MYRPRYRAKSRYVSYPAQVDERVATAEKRSYEAGVHEAEERAQEAEARIRREEARNREELEAALQRTERVLNQMRVQAQRSEAELDRLRALPDPDVSPIQSAPGWHDEDYESVRRYESEDVRLAAGTGTFADREPVGPQPSLAQLACAEFDLTCDSVTFRATGPTPGEITSTREAEEQWQMMITLDDRARIMGRVVWWAHTD